MVSDGLSTLRRLAGVAGPRYLHSVTRQRQVLVRHPLAVAVVVPDDGLDVHCGTTMVQEVVCAGLGVGDVAGPVGIGNEPSSLSYGGGGFEGDHCDLLGVGACQVAFS